MLASVVALANWRGLGVPPLWGKGVKRCPLETKEYGEVAAGTAGTAGATAPAGAAAGATGDAVGVAGGAAKVKRY